MKKSSLRTVEAIKNHEKIGTVIAPKKWFGPNNAHLDTSDLYPESWTVI